MLNHADYRDLGQDVHYGLRMLRPFQLELVQKIELVTTAAGFTTNIASHCLPRSPAFHPTELRIMIVLDGFFEDHSLHDTLTEAFLKSYYRCHCFPKSIRSVIIENDQLSSKACITAAALISKLHFHLDGGTIMTTDGSSSTSTWTGIYELWEGVEKSWTYHTIRMAWKPESGIGKVVRDCWTYGLLPFSNVADLEPLQEPGRLCEQVE
jgi:hypothetical protein